MADLSTAFAEALASALDSWLDEQRVLLNTAARSGCYCAKNTKPCPTHDAYDDGICDLIDAIQGVHFGGTDG